MRATIRLTCEMTDRPGVAAQLVGHDDPWNAEPTNQSPREPLRCSRIPLLLHQDIKHLIVCIHGPPEPEFYTVVRHDDGVEVPLVPGSRPVSLDGGGNMEPEAIDPSPDGFSPDGHTALGKQAFYIAGAEGEPLIRPDRVGNNFTAGNQSLSGAARFWAP